MDKMDEMPEISPDCSNYVKEYMQIDSEKWQSLKSCDTYSKRVDLELQKRKEGQKILQKQIKDLTSQRMWFIEEKHRLASGELERDKNQTKIVSTPGINVYTAGNSPHSREGESKRAEQPRPLTAHDYQPSESPDRSFVTIPESYPQLSSRRDLISENYHQAHADIGAPPTNLYNDLPANSPNTSNIYSSKPFIRKEDHGNKLVGLQCIVTKDFTADNPSEIDLYLNDWVELKNSDGNRYYGSVFGRSGQCEGWFHKSHVEVIPDSKVGSLTFRYVVRAEVNYLTEEAGFLSYRCGDKFDVLEEKVSVEEDRKHVYYRVRNKTGEMGLVVQLGFTKCQGENPVLHERQWYYPKMTRMKAEEELKASNVDTFLVRDSSHALGNYTISVRGKDRVLHVIVITHRKGYQARQDKFKSLDEILDYYRAYPIIRNVRLLKSLQPEEGHFYQNVTHDLT